MNFRYPKKYVFVGVGNRIDEGKDKQGAYSSWKSDIPLKVAGFNIGDFKMMTINDERTGTVLEGFATSSPPDILMQEKMAELPSLNSSRSGGMSSIQGSMSPKQMMEGAVVTSQGSTQLFTHWFGPLPYGRMAITQQPQFGFGQSWPTYHDQWISEGFSDFSAGLYLQGTGQQQAYMEFLRKWREIILEKNQFGYSANDVGPLWMGQRLMTPKTGSAYRKLIYPKGGFILHMLRQLMFDPRNGGDQPFMTMMQDFVKTHHNKDASTESFQASVEKHMTPAMDIDGNGKMDWFFNQWVYGNKIPSYELNYSLTANEGGGSQLRGTITQSGVSQDFMMTIPIYVEVEGKLRRLGSSNIFGNAATPEFDLKLPWMPDSVTINAYNDVLADNLSVKRH